MSTIRTETIGDCTLYCGDCRDILGRLGSFDALVTDPPYGIGGTAGGPESRAREKGAYVSEFDDAPQYVRTVCAPVVEKILASTTRGAISCGRTNIWLYPPATDVGCFYQPAASGTSFWGRPTWQPILFYGRAPHAGQQLMPLHRVVTEAAEACGHPCPKPIKAWQWVVHRTSKIGETVIDPFMGSGTTGVACVKLGRKFIGIELEPAYFDIACRRVEEAHRQPDLFICDPIPKAEQLALI